MKRCPVCSQTYTDPNINFCLSDGELLSRLTEPSPFAKDEPPPTRFADDAPPTLMMGSSRVTNQNWQTAQPPAPWQPQTPAAAGFASMMPHLQPKNHTLPTVSLILGISSLIFVCCFGGIWLGIPAAIVGFLGMRNADREPDKFGGRGMAVGGMVIGVIAFIMSILYFLLAVIGG
jgi:hypothetical protein